MKAIRILLLSLAAAFLFTGCFSSYRQDPSSMQMVDFSVRQSDWYEGDGMYEAVLSVPEITQSVLKNGNVQVSRRYPGENNGADVWTPLPAMRTEATTLDNGQEFIYTTFIDYEWTIGEVNIYVTTSDLYTGVRPSAMNFRVIVTR